MGVQIILAVLAFCRALDCPAELFCHLAFLPKGSGKCRAS